MKNGFDEIGKIMVEVISKIVDHVPRLKAGLRI
jgi:hypothetical protein